MPAKNRKKLGLGWVILIVIVLLVGLFLLIRRFLYGHNIVLFNPQGHIAREQYSLMIYTITVLFAIVIPTVLLAYFIAWNYRETNAKATYAKTVHGGKLLVLTMWAVPTIIMLILASAMIPATHNLAPQKSIAAEVKPLTIQVVAMRWKWLFIYPEQNIATVNFVQFPVNTPVRFELTADEAPMSSFWIPNLGGQLYAMTGHSNTLNLMADISGDFPGSSAEINGAGFAGMKFTARASSAANFELWVQEVKQSPEVLDTLAYEKLLLPSKNNSVAHYSASDINIYEQVFSKYIRSNKGQEHHR